MRPGETLKEHGSSVYGAQQRDEKIAPLYLAHLIPEASGTSSSESFVLPLLSTELDLSCSLYLYSTYRLASAVASPEELNLGTSASRGTPR